MYYFDSQITTDSNMTVYSENIYLRIAVGEDIRFYELMN